MIIGYARVSREDQDLGRQVKALKDCGCEIVYGDRISGVRSVRPELDKMVKSLQRGDIVVVQKLDRLGRSLKHLIELVMDFKEKGVGFKVIDGSIDTTSPQGKFVFHVIGAMAELEREMISERTRDALAYKRSIGVRLGRPEKIDVNLLIKFKKLKDKGCTRSQIMAELGITMYKYYSLKCGLTCVYIFHQQGTDLYKIGRTNNIRSRLVSLNVSSHTTKIVVYKAFKTSNAKLLEEKIHRLMDDKRTLGEWFKLSSDDLEMIDLAISGLTEKTTFARVPGKLQAAFEYSKTKKVYEKES